MSARRAYLAPVVKYILTLPRDTWTFPSPIASRRIDDYAVVELAWFASPVTGVS